jgi:predicted transcriptional regulator
MTVTIPPEIEHDLAARAERDQTSVESVVRQALAWYLQTDPETIDELEAWQEVRDEALRLVEDGPT